MTSLRPSSLVAGKYRLLERLGLGGMGEVWVAENVVLHKRVALKVMRPECAADAVASERFLQEAAVASRVRHPAIVDVHDAGVDAGMPWMAMELLPGESLASRIARRPLAIAEIPTHLGPIVDALAAIHDAGIVHRDLKPDNVFLEETPSGVQPKLLDFGIAKQVGVSRMTKTGELIGTGHYLSPEQARGARDVDARSDLYSMGVVLYEALSGTTPHQAETLPELIAKLFTEAPRPLRAVAPWVPEPLASLVHRCLERDPMMRPRDARTLREALERAARPAPPPLTPGGTVRMSSVPPPLPRRRTSPLPLVPTPTLPPAPRRAFRLSTPAALVLFAAIWIGTFVTCGLVDAMSRTSHPGAAPPARVRVALTPPPVAPRAPTSSQPEDEPEDEPEATVPRIVVDRPLVTTSTHRPSMVRAGEVDVRGAIRPEEARRTVRAVLPAIDRDVRGSRARVRPAQLVVEVWVGSDGRVSRAFVLESTSGDPTLDDAIAAHFRSARWASGSRPSSVTVALVIDS